MSLSVVQILYNGNKKSIKLSPNDSIQSIIDKSINQFNITTNNRYILKHKNKVLDSNLPIRYCTILNNAVLDLIIQPSVSNINGKVKVALTILSKSLIINEVDSSISDEFDVSSSLLDMLNHFIRKNKITSDCIDLNTEIVIVYLRKSINKNDYSSHTFQSLGLSGQGVRLQIRLTDAFTTIAMSNSDKTTETIISTNDSTIIANDNSIDVISPIDNNKINNSDNSETNTAITNQSIETSDATSLTLETNNITGESTEEIIGESTEQSNNIANEPLNIQAAIDKVLSSNFDAISLPALVVILKYLTNIINNPSNNKYRYINTNNKIFIQKIRNVANISTVFDSIGFVISNDQLVLSDRIDIQKLIDGYQVLYKVLIDSNISVDELPTIKSFDDPVVTTVPPVNFDPYKSMITRNAPQPSRSASLTEIKLDTLNKKRRELEGEPSDIERNTEVIFPNIESNNTTTDVITNDDTEQTNDQSTINKSLIKRLKQVMSSNNEGPPLTTKALRELEKIQSERIYNKILIRVRFSDKVTLQGRFHPRNTIAEVFSWVNDCLHSDYKYEDEYKFELYTSPPKCIYDPLSSSTLYDLHLIPAAMLYLSWKKTNNGSSNSTQALGYYLIDSLSNLPDVKSNIIKVDLYPKGETLTTTSPIDQADSKGDSKSETKSINNTSSNKDNKQDNKSKPIWFKI